MGLRSQDLSITWVLTPLQPPNRTDPLRTHWLPLKIPSYGVCLIWGPLGTTPSCHVEMASQMPDQRRERSASPEDLNQDLGFEVEI